MGFFLLTSKQTHNWAKLADLLVLPSSQTPLLGFDMPPCLLDVLIFSWCVCSQVMESTSWLSTAAVSAPLVRCPVVPKHRPRLCVPQDTRSKSHLKEIKGWWAWLWDIRPWPRSSQPRRRPQVQPGRAGQGSWPAHCRALSSSPSKVGCVAPTEGTSTCVEHWIHSERENLVLFLVDCDSAQFGGRNCAK